MANSNSAPAPGGWTDEALAATVSEHGGIGSDAGLPEPERFVAGVAKLLVRRAYEAEAEEEPEDPDIAIFVLQPYPPDDARNTRHEPMLTNGLTRVVGRLWFTPAPVLTGHYVDLPEGSNDVRINYVAKGLALGNRPTLIYDPRPRSPELRWYPEGLNQISTVEFKPLAGDVSPEDVFETIDRIHSECLVTPNALPPSKSLWTDSYRYRPLSNAETELQTYLLVGLTSRFPFCTVRHEQPQPAGRVDLEIEQLDPADRARVLRHATIELKVLRSYYASGSTVSDAETRDWIRKGVDQASAYRSGKNCRWAALCCFDMRTMNDPTCFDDVEARATRLEVHLRRWFLYASAEAYQQAQAQQALNSSP